MKARPVFDASQVNEAAEYLEKELRDLSAKADHARDLDGKRMVQEKRNILNTLIEDAARADPREKAVFVSLSGDFRKLHLKRITDICMGAQFTKVLTGFDDDVGDHGDLKTEIMFRIREAHAFLGIWSDDFKLHGTKKKGENAKTAPRVWMPLELGMALVTNKPFHLILHENTEHSYLRPVNELVQGWYDDTRSLDEAIETAANRLFAKTEALLSSPLGG